MRMGKKSVRGMKYKTTDGCTVTFLETRNEDAIVTGENDKQYVISRDTLDLPIIDTKDYEKIQ